VLEVVVAHRCDRCVLLACVGIIINSAYVTEVAAGARAFGDHDGASQPSGGADPFDTIRGAGRLHEVTRIHGDAAVP
jgi:hypothetical protein